MAPWRADIESWSFVPAGHEGSCVVHRRAFGTLLGRAPYPEDCERYFEAHRAAFEQAALSKIKRAHLTPSAHFHLNSRDIARAEVTPP